MIVLYFNNDIHDLLTIFMGMWVIVNWWVWPVPDFYFRMLEAMKPGHKLDIHRHQCQDSLIR